MPKVHRYSHSNGLYIKAKSKGLMTTYQVSPEGVQLLLNLGHGEGTTLSVHDLLLLIKRGYAYTGGSGPGRVDQDFVPPPLPEPIRNSTVYPRDVQFDAISRPIQPTDHLRSQEQVPAWVVWVVLLLALIVIGIIIGISVQNSCLGWLLIGIAIIVAAKIANSM